MSRSFKNMVSQPTQQQAPKKFKRHFHKKVRQKTKSVINDFVQGVVDEIVTDELLDYNQEIQKGG